jgi:hypothetical protein
MNMILQTLQEWSQWPLWPVYALGFAGGYIVIAEIRQRRKTLIKPQPAAKPETVEKR